MMRGMFPCKHDSRAVLLRNHPERRSGAAPGAGSLPGTEDITREELPNGIVILSRANFNSPSVVISGSLPAGSLFDADEKLGLADFTSAALMRGTQGRNFQQIYDVLESAGASLGFSGGTHTVGFGAKALVEDLDLLLDLLAEALIRPVFPTEQVERLRTNLLTGLAMRAQDTADMASLLFDQIIYPEHPYRRPDDGYPETIQAIQQRDLVEFHSQQYGPRGMILAIVGGLDPAETVEKVKRALGVWNNPRQQAIPALPQVKPLTETVLRRVTIAGKSQSDLVIGAAGPRRTAPDYLAAALGNSILGQFGMMGRIGEALREQAGLAYYASSSLSGGPGPGPWEIGAGVNPQDVDQAIELLIEQLQHFTSRAVSAEELADSQANFIGRLPLSLESNAGVASALTHLERYNLGLDYYRLYPGQVRAVTQEQILETASRYLDPQRLGIVIAGP
jgi:zinc protease